MRQYRSTNHDRPDCQVELVVLQVPASRSSEPWTARTIFFRFPNLFLIFNLFLLIIHYSLFQFSWAHICFPIISDSFSFFLRAHIFSFYYFPIFILRLLHLDFIHSFLSIYALLSNLFFSICLSFGFRIRSINYISSSPIQIKPAPWMARAYNQVGRAREARLQNIN